jgi:hypothetical protein
MLHTISKVVRPEIGDKLTAVFIFHTSRVQAYSVSLKIGGQIWGDVESWGIETGKTTRDG